MNLGDVFVLFGRGSVALGFHRVGIAFCIEVTTFRGFIGFVFRAFFSALFG